MKIVDCDQRSGEWRRIRLGRLTASRVGDAFAKIKSGTEAAGRRNLRVQLVLERLTGQPQENGFVSSDMERGMQLEADAYAAYEAETRTLLRSVGFIAHDELMAGCSPDGIAGDGLVDFKCPKAAIHLDYLRGGLPLEYRLQLIHGLWLSGFSWADFASFHPDFPEPLRLKVTRLFAKDIDLAAHELNVRLFLDEVDREVLAVGELVTAGAA